MSGAGDIGAAGPERPDLEALAAEYVLGTLDAVERASVSARLDINPDMAAAVARWEAALAPLGLDGEGEAPPEGVWAEIKRRIALMGPAGRPALHAVKESIATPEEEPSGAWRIFALAASLAALVLGGLLVRDRLAPPSAPAEPLVAALSADGKAPAFLVSVDVEKRELTIRRIGADAPADRSHELWLVSDKVEGGKPVSLGLVGGAPSAAALAKYQPTAFEGATYAVSLEPRGGSKTGAPTGPVVFSGKLEQLPKVRVGR